MRPRLPHPASVAPPPGTTGDVSSEPMARPFALMFATGGALTLAHLALPDNGSSNNALLAAAAGACFALSAVIWLTWRHLPAWSYQLFLTAASLLTACVVYASGDSTSARRSPGRPTRSSRSSEYAIRMPPDDGGGFVRMSRPW